MWWLGFALALVPFSYGLVYMWRRVGDTDAVVHVPLLGGIEGPTGFVVFAIGVFGCSYCLWQIADEPGPVPELATGNVTKVSGFTPLDGILSGPAGERQLAAWLKQFQQNARVVVELNGRQDAEHGDYLATLRSGAGLPKRLATLDSDTTALLRVSGGSPPTVNARIEPYSIETAGELSSPVTGKDAMKRKAPVGEGRRVVVITHAERGAYDELHERQQAASDTTTVSEKNARLKDVIRLSDDFMVGYPGGFFTADVLLRKGRAQRGLGQQDEALVNFRRIPRFFPNSPRASEALEAIKELNSQLRQPEAVPAASAPNSVGRDEPTVAPSQASAAERGDSAGTHGRAVVVAVAGRRPVVPVRVIAAQASSTLPAQGRVDFGAANTLDGSRRTAWSARGDGKGKSLTFRFNNSYAVTALRLVNGYARSRALFKANSRPRTVRVQTARGTKTVRFRNTPERQTVGIPSGRTRWVRLTIVNAYRGTVTKNTMLSEVEFLTSVLRTRSHHRGVAGVRS